MAGGTSRRRGDQSRPQSHGAPVSSDTPRVDSTGASSGRERWRPEAGEYLALACGAIGLDLRQIVSPRRDSMTARARDLDCLLGVERYGVLTAIPSATLAKSRNGAGQTPMSRTAAPQSQITRSVNVAEAGYSWRLGGEKKPGRLGAGGWWQTGSLYTLALTVEDGATGLYVFAN